MFEKCPFIIFLLLVFINKIVLMKKITPSDFEWTWKIMKKNSHKLQNNPIIICHFLLFTFFSCLYVELHAFHVKNENECKECNSFSLWHFILISEYPLCQRQVKFKLTFLAWIYISKTDRNINGWHTISVGVKDFFLDFKN